MKKTLCCLFAVILVLTMSLPVAAFAPYDAYTYDSYGYGTLSANGYEVDLALTSENLGLGGSIVDVHYAEGRLYVLGDNGIAVLENDLSPVQMITEFRYQGEVLTFNKPRGLFVQDENHILVADTENRRILECSIEGEVSRILEKPTRVGAENQGYLEKLDFRPIKALYAGQGDVYVLVENCYLGILRYNADGTFHSFFAANQVSPTLELMIDRMWKKLLTKQQQKYIANYVPVDYTSFDIDQEGFIYTTTSRTTTAVEEIQKLNTVGKNILRSDMQYDTLNRGDYGDREKVAYRQWYYDSKIHDIAAGDHGIFAALDQARGRVFVYDQDSNLLFAFGGSGEQKGLFRQATAIEYMDNNRLVVLDSDKNAITVFSPTDFGDLVLEATAHNRLGRYDLALEPWQKVLQMDANYEIAYRGIGKAYVSKGLYEEALPYLKRGGDRENYSKAFKVVRNDVLQENFYWMLLGGALLIAVLVWRKKIWHLITGGKKLLPMLSEEVHPTYPMRHLVIGFEGLRRVKGNAPVVVGFVLVGLNFLASLFMRRYTGFIFNMENPQQLNVLLVAAGSIGIFFLWCISAFGVSSMLDGEGNLRRIFLVSSYALVPLTIAQFAYVAFSNVAIFEEGTMLNALLVIGYIWSAWLLFYGIKEAHQFSVSRTLLTILMTVIGMLFCGLVLVLVYGLVGQLITFIMTIVNELVLRSI